MWSGELLESDRHLHHAGPLLDATRMRPVVDEHLLTNPSARFRIEFVRFKPGLDLTVLYAFDVSGAASFAYARAFAERTRLDEVVQKSDRRRRLGRSATHPVARIDDPPAVLFAFPNDSEVIGLRLLADREAVARVLTRRCPDFSDVDPDTVHTELIRYRPESRCVCRADFETTSGPGSAMVKAYGSERTFRRAVTATDATMRANDALSFRPADTFGTYARRRIVVAARHAGTSIEQRLREGAPVDLHDVGRRLARWHGAAIDEGRSSTDADMRNTLSTWFPLVHDPEVRRVWETVLSSPATTHVRHRIHGDFHAGQVLSGTPPTLIDLDGMGVDTPLADLATFVAVELTRKHGAPADEILRAFIDGYRSAATTPPDEDALRTFIALAVLDRSTSGLAKLRRSWKRRLEHAARLAADILGARKL